LSGIPDDPSASPSENARGRTSTARTSAETSAIALAAQRRSDAATATGTSAVAATYGVNATIGTSGQPRSRPSARISAHPAQNATSSQTMAASP
jgi:hypothetical protein